MALKLAGLLGIHGLFVVFVSKKIVLLPYMIVWQILYISDIIECKDNTILSSFGFQNNAILMLLLEDKSKEVLEWTYNYYLIKKKYIET